MSAFEFFFSFYGLLLGLSVAELVGGFARVLHEQERIRFGWLTPLLAIFVAVDIATFWGQAWVIFRDAPFNLSLLVVALAIAATFYVAASITFPRVTSEGRERIDLNAHFWAHRRMVLACIMVANLIVALLLLALAAGNEGFARIAAVPRLWIGLTIFVLGAAVAAFAPWRRVAVGALILLVVFHAWNVWHSAQSLVAVGGWSPPAA
jgi:Ca2+/Na+ antiporter